MQGVFVCKTTLDHIYDQFQLGHMNWENWYSAIYKRWDKKIQLFCPLNERLEEQIRVLNAVNKYDYGVFEVKEWFNGFDPTCSAMYIVDHIGVSEYQNKFYKVDETVHKIERIPLSAEIKEFPIKANEIIDVVNAIIDELFVEVHAKINIDGTNTRDCIDASQIIQGKISSKLYDVGGNVVEEVEPQLPYVEYTEIDKGNYNGAE